MNEEKFTIHVQIGGYPIALHIVRKDEELYRRAGEIVTKLISEYSAKYGEQSYEDILKLVAFNLAVAVSKNQFNEDPSPIADRLKAMEGELDKVLN